MQKNLLASFYKNEDDCHDGYIHCQKNSLPQISGRTYSTGRAEALLAWFLPARHEYRRYKKEIDFLTGNSLFLSFQEELNMQELWLKNKCLVIIGGTTGIGLSAAQAFIRHGANVVAIGRNPESVEKASSLLKNGVVDTGDASESGTTLKAINNCIKHFGGFDGLYHVAGGSGRKFGDGPLHEITKEGWDHTLSLNLTSLMLSNQAAVKSFLERKTRGSILNMGSVLGYAPSPKYFVTHAYAAAKSAAIGFTKSIASYYAFNNIRINLIAPGLVETPMAQRAAKDENILSFIKTKQPLDGGRIGTPADLDGAAVYFMSDYSRFTTGQILSVDGGWSLAEGQYA